MWRIRACFNSYHDHHPRLVSVHGNYFYLRDQGWISTRSYHVSALGLYIFAIVLYAWDYTSWYVEPDPAPLRFFLSNPNQYMPTLGVRHSAYMP